MNRKESIIQDIRDLRDDDSHVCPADKDDYLECTCTKYDHVIDKLEDFITELKDKIIYGYDLVERTKFKMSIEELCRITNYEDGLNSNCLIYTSEEDRDLHFEQNVENK